MSEGSGSDRHSSQRESPVNEGDVGPVSQRIGESSQPVVSSAQMQEILHRWYNIDKDFLFDFPEHFMEVPAMESSSMYWTKPMSSKEVIERLRGEKANEAEGDHLIQPIMAYYKDVVSSTQKLLAEHKKKFNSNLHHWNVLLSSRASKKVPKFLMMDAPVLKPELFPDGDISNLKTEFRSILDKAAELMVEATIQEREKIDARLRREAVELLGVVRESAMKKWMDAQRSIDCTFNRWDLIFPVEMWNSTTSSRQAIPISSVIFRTAMKACQSNICRERETELQQKSDAQNALQREKDKRRQAQSKASSLPPREAEKSLDKRMEEKLAPMRDDLREIKAMLQSNVQALERADPSRDDDRSARGTHAQKQTAAAKVVGPSRTSRKRSHKGQRERPQRGPSASANADHPATGRRSLAADPINASVNGSEDGQRSERRRRKRKRKDASQALN